MNDSAVVKKVFLLGLFILLCILVFFKWIPVYAAAVVFAVVFVFSVRDYIYYAWVSQKEQDAFQQKMGSIISEINKQEAPAIETIPRIIIQMWVQKDGKSPKIPPFEQKYMEQMKKLNPHFEHKFFDGNEIDIFFNNNYPEYYSTYQQLPEFIQKLDFFRYLAISSLVF